MGQSGPAGAVVKGIQERELLPVGVFLGALHWLFCAALFCDWLIDDFDIGDKGFNRTVEADGRRGPGRGGLVEVQRNVGAYAPEALTR